VPQMELLDKGAGRAAAGEGENRLVLIVDDEPLFREIVAETLEAAGYRTLGAGDGAEAMNLLRTERPDLVLLDLTLPGVDGLTLLRFIREEPATAAVPVVIVSGRSEKATILHAVQLRVQGYVLKSGFSLKTLLAKVREHVRPAEPAPAPAECAAALPTTPPQPPAVAAPEAPLVEAPAGRSAGSLSPLLSREEALRRAEAAEQGRTLSGVVTQVMSMAASPRGDMAELAGLIARDAVLSARVLQAANSAAFASNKGVVTTIAEAVRHIGCGTVRNIAAAVEVIDAVPREEAGAAFNPVRHWQHSFAVAVLCERLAGGTDAGAAHLVGLCHVLPKILFHARFDREYAAVLGAAAAAGKPPEEVERVMLGATRGELIMAVLRSLKLPDLIREPIEQYLAAGGRPGAGAGRLARILRIADLYANGVLLACSPQSPIACLTQAEFRGATGHDRAPAYDSDALRAEVLSLTAMLARLSPEEERELMKPLLPRCERRLWVARDPALCPLDPVTAALASVAEVDLHDRLPISREERSDHAALVVLSRAPGAAGFSAGDITRAREVFDGVPVLWLSGRADAVAADAALVPVTWPVPLSRLGEFVAGID